LIDISPDLTKTTNNRIQKNWWDLFKSIKQKKTKTKKTKNSSIKERIITNLDEEKII
jgi:hypothetical protein